MTLSQPVDKLVEMKSVEIGAFEAKTHFSELIRKTELGESFIITKRGKPVARLGPASLHRKLLTPGCAPNSIEFISEDFDAPLKDMRDYMQ